ncbi:MAG: hypothetical protein HQL31_11265, partial [Planctomycetes bacterium]|nr:hypothetical protein [Planctomycetota bacterium]
SRLKNGTRIHILLPPAAGLQPCLRIVKARFPFADLPGLVACGAMSDDIRSVLEQAQIEKRSITVTGVPGLDKGFFVSCLTAGLPAHVLAATNDISGLCDGSISRLIHLGRDLSFKNKILDLAPEWLVRGLLRPEEVSDLLGLCAEGRFKLLYGAHAALPADHLLCLRMAVQAKHPGLVREDIEKLISNALDLYVHLDSSGKGVHELGTFTLGPDGILAPKPLVSRSMQNDTDGLRHMRVKRDAPPPIETGKVPPQAFGSTQEHEA